MILCHGAIYTKICFSVSRNATASLVAPLPFPEGSPTPGNSHFLQDTDSLSAVMGNA